ncbi:GreA/GreB family elongation factor [Aureitalea sp. L0-47]|uniref:GreA/GreB family elongation factor n=1 Tax=Aureitalea sp. L0-47 TaxID=2816962 RepID=UPI0022381818|nr:GreA/GreB family elongation factor [Aureitalea sp. L0-47]MCW5519887.1 GreA/GreB family elongation factor [Aureitalea sp. L0-47]
MTNQEIKKILFQNCEEYISGHRDRINNALDAVKESLFDEEKSTVGDKHHTNRAMLQIEREKFSHQLVEVDKEEAVLNKISLEHINDIVHLGSLVITNNGNYFMSVSAGVVSIGDKTFYCISLKSPIGKLLLGKKQGESVTFNKRTIELLEVD